MQLLKHLAFILLLSLVLSFSFNLVLAQEEKEKSLVPSSGFSTIKLIVFVVAVVISVVTDSIMCLSLAGSPHILRVVIESAIVIFINVYWWDFIAPFVAGIPFMTMKFMQVGNPAWNYWIGTNVIVVLIIDFILSQVVFRFARGAATSSNIADLVLALLDAFMPAILFLILPMVGVV